MVKMKLGSDLGSQQIVKLNEYFLVVDRIRKAGCNAQQGNGRLKSKMSNLTLLEILGFATVVCN
jgi:cell division protein YceG involved in septum cleavage